MMNLLELLASAIATQEGFYAEGPAAAKTNNNPGNLRASVLPRKKSDAGFVIFTDAQEGYMALVTQLMLFVIKGFTLRQVIESWAPRTGADGGNATDTYLANTARRTGIDPDVKLKSLFHFERLV